MLVRLLLLVFREGEIKLYADWRKRDPSSVASEEASLTEKETQEHRIMNCDNKRATY